MRRAAALLLALVVVMAAAPGVSGAQREDQLRLALVIPLGSGPLFTPTGEPARDANARLRTIGDALRALARPELADVPFALAPSPVFCDEMQQLGGTTAARALTILRALAEDVPILSAPYAQIRLSNVGTSRAVTKELSEGHAALRRCTGVSPIGVLATPDLRVTAVALDGVAAHGSNAVLAPTDLVPRRPSESGSTILIPTDLIPPEYTPDAAFGLFQGLEAAAALLAPERSDLATFLRAIANDPRIHLTAMSELITDAPRTPVAFPRPTAAPASYRRAIDSAVQAMARFRGYTLPANRLQAVMRTSLARARSSAEWNERWSTGRRRARSIVGALRRQEKLVSAAGGSVTFTSQSGSVPVTVTNSATYPVRVRVRLSSAKLRFPDGSARTVAVDPPGDTIVFAALARSTGSFPVQVRVTSPDGVIPFHTGELIVRSTAANVPALVITSGAALFLLAWYARHLARRRRERHEPNG